MRVSLVFPPATDPRAPHLALPSLTAALRSAGIETTQRDADIDGLLWLIEPARVAAAIETCERRLRAEPDPRLERVLRRAEPVLEQIAAAPGALRARDTFLDPHAHHHARDVISGALELASAAAGDVSYGISPIHYRVDGIDDSRLPDLIAATDDPRFNLFHDFYASDVVPRIVAEEPDLVGVSILNAQQILPSLMLARQLKAAGLFVVIGGTVYSKFVPQLRARPEFFRHFCDALVAYEGETALLALLDELAGRRNFAAVPNLLSLDPNGRVVMGRPHVENVDTLPTPDFDGLPLDRYLAPVPVLPILTGKGCYFNRCKFCDIPSINSIAPKAYRVRDPEKIAGDVAALNARHGARHFVITDEALAPKLLLQLADALDGIPAHVQPRFTGYARLEAGFTPDACRRIHDMGVRKLFFGLESGSQRTLDHMDKGIRLDVAESALRHCAEAGIAFHLFSIVGFPEESEAGARETLSFLFEHAELLDAPQNSFDVHPFMLDLRTDYYDNAARYGVEIDAEDLASRDFPLSVDRWTNTRGIDGAQSDALVAEFHARLRERYPAYRRFPLHLWPGFEEYSLLYCDRYADRPFGYRFDLPRHDDPGAFRLLWSDGVRVEVADDGCRVRSLNGEAVVAPALVGLLAQPKAAQPVASLLSSLAAEEAFGGAPGVAGQLRDAINLLLDIGALQLRPESRPESVDRV